MVVPKQIGKEVPYAYESFVSDLGHASGYSKDHILRFFHGDDLYHNLSSGNFHTPKEVEQKIYHFVKKGGKINQTKLVNRLTSRVKDFQKQKAKEMRLAAEKKERRLQKSEAEKLKFYESEQVTTTDAHRDIRRELQENIARLPSLQNQETEKVSASDKAKTAEVKEFIDKQREKNKQPLVPPKNRGPLKGKEYLASAAQKRIRIYQFSHKDKKKTKPDEEEIEDLPL